LTSEDGGQAVFNFDGLGNIKLSIITVFNGQVFRNSGSLLYTVNSDGSGTIVPPSGGKGPQIAFALNTVTAGQAKGLQFLDTNTSDGPGNLVITGVVVKQ
jgi:hypothetical protein